MTAARVCFWCDGGPRPRAPLLWDRSRESYCHRACKRPGAELVEPRGHADGSEADAVVGELETDAES